MEWFDRVVLGFIRELMRAARENYGVDPVAFLVIYLASVPFFYFSIYRMLRALARRQQQQIIVWSMVFLGSTAAPFVYVLHGSDVLSGKTSYASLCSDCRDCVPKCPQGLEIPELLKDVVALFETGGVAEREAAVRQLFG